jgi:hypothetical protein
VGGVRSQHEARLPGPSDRRHSRFAIFTPSTTSTIATRFPAHDLSTGVTYKCEGCPARWRGIYDDRERVEAPMTFDSDLGDSWEWADDPRYDEKFSALGIGIGVNYVIFAMTH